MKVLFLDIDGVVNCQSTTAKHGLYIGIDPVMAERVRRIIKETGCEVVLSSTWRLDPGSRAEVQKRVCLFIDVTPRAPDMRDRGNEVEAWLKLHPEVTRYAILDDNNWFNEGQPLFQTTWAEGLTDEIADNVITYLLHKHKRYGKL